MTVLLILVSDLFQYCTQDELKEELDVTQNDKYLIDSDGYPQANDVAELFTANGDNFLDAKLPECTGKVIRSRPVPVFGGCLGNCIRLPFRKIRRAFRGKRCRNTKGQCKFAGRGSASSKKSKTSLGGRSACKDNASSRNKVQQCPSIPAARPTRPRSAVGNQFHICDKRMSGVQAKGVYNNKQLNPRLLTKMLREEPLALEQSITSNGGLSWTLTDLDQDRNLMFSRASLHKERLKTSRGRNNSTSEV